MQDRYATFITGLESPAQDGFAITPSDSEGLPETTRALYIGIAGNIAVTLLSGAQLTFSNVPSGTLLSIRAISVKASGTTATNMLGLL